MTPNAGGEFSLLRLMPPLRRARGFRLYTGDGGRLIDLWQNGGAAALGHTPPSLLRELKNAASRGLYAPFPHLFEGRFLKALSRLFPGRTIRLYAAPPPALEALVSAGTAALWRPFLDSGAPLQVPPDAPPILIPVLPGIQGWRGGLPQGLCVLAGTADGVEELPPGDLLSPALLAVATRGVYDVIAAAPERATPAVPRLTAALSAGPWQRRGIYCSLRQRPDAETWAALFRRFLAAGFLLPPVPDQPLIIPGVLSPGEEAKLAELVAAY